MPGPSRLRLVLLALLAASGCGGGSGGSIPLSDLGARLLDAICSREVRCGVYPDKATCAATLGNLLDEAQLTADVNAGRVVYDGKAAADCLSTAYDSPSGFGSCSNTVALSAPGTPSCGDAIKGTLATGAACFDSDVCLSGSCDRSACTSGAACCMGVCAAAKTTVGIGDDCSSATVACPEASFCPQSSPTGTSPMCTAKIAAGQPCTNLTDCASGTLCVSDATTGAGACGKLPTRGQSCMASQFCDAVTDYCNTTTGLCTARVAPGGACPMMNSCVAYATCSATTTTSVAQGMEGAVCAAAADCLSGNCAAGSCAVQPAAVVCP
jgi:hypothetical protein